MIVERNPTPSASETQSQRAAESVADSVRHVRSVDFELREALNAGECRWLIARLLERRGVLSVHYSPDACSLHIEYDGERMTTPRLVDFLRICGVAPAVVLRND
jgi:hypothetical protein